MNFELEKILFVTKNHNEIEVIRWICNEYDRREINLTCVCPHPAAAAAHTHMDMETDVSRKMIKFIHFSAFKKFI